MHAFHLKFTINAYIVWIPVETTFSTPIVCPNHHLNILTVAYRSVYCVPTYLIPSV